MGFNSLIEETISRNDCAQLFVQYDPEFFPLAVIVRLVEEQGGDIKAVEIEISDVPYHKIARFKLGNGKIQNIVISLSENGINDVQGIDRRKS